jgi:hypothetical protein
MLFVAFQAITCSIFLRALLKGLGWIHSESNGVVFIVTLGLAVFGTFVASARMRRAFKVLMGRTRGSAHGCSQTGDGASMSRRSARNGVPWLEGAGLVPADARHVIEFQDDGVPDPSLGSGLEDGITLWTHLDNFA